jgi:hypothetical protein
MEKNISATQSGVGKGARDRCPDKAWHCLLLDDELQHFQNVMLPQLRYDCAVYTCSPTAIADRVMTRYHDASFKDV